MPSKTRTRTKINLSNRKKTKSPKNKSVPAPNSVKNDIKKKWEGKKKQDPIKNIEYTLLFENEIIIQGIGCKRTYDSTNSLGENYRYFHCPARRKKNNLTKEKNLCKFSGRVLDFNSKEKKGYVEILKEHVSTYPYFANKLNEKTCNSLSENISSHQQNLNENTEADSFEKTEINTHNEYHQNYLANLPANLEENKDNDSTVKNQAFDFLNNQVNPTKESLKHFLSQTIPIENRISTYQINNLWKQWKKMYGVSTEDFVFQNPFTTRNLPFFRVQEIFYYQYNGKNKLGKIIIFASDFQLNRLKLADHFHIDGKFGCIPRGYKQIITLLIRDPNS